MRLLDAPQTWIAVAVVLLVIAIVLLLLARRGRRSAVTGPAAQGGAVASSRASYDPATDGADPPTDPVDLRPIEPVGRAGGAPAAAEQPSGEHNGEGQAHTQQAAPAVVGPPESDQHGSDLRGSDLHGLDLHGSDLDGLDLHGSDLDGSDLDGSDQHGSAKDRLLAALLEDPQSAVSAVARIDAANGSGPPGGSVASLLRAGMTPAQVASLCGTRESALAEVVARDLGLLTAPDATSEPGRAPAGVSGSSGSTTPTPG